MQDMSVEFESIERSFNSEDIEGSLLILSEKAEAGDAKSQFLLGHGLHMKYFMDNYGQSVDEDETDEINKKIIYWTTKSAGQGYALAQFSLGSIYSDEDRCGEVDYIKGLMWSILGSMHSTEDTDETINQYIEEHGMSDEDIIKAKHLAHEWQPS